MNARLNAEALQACVPLTLDGQPVLARPNETIWQLAQRLGQTIPHLCHSDGLRPDGNCRACVVEVAGERTLSASCCRVASAGLDVKTQSERAVKSRALVLELLLAAGEPVKAYDLIARFGEDGQPAKPPTVYRALEFLERKGLAHRIASISAYVACTSGAIDHAAAFLICDCCGATAEVSAPVAGDLARAAEVAGYVIARTTIEAHGRCPACQ